MNKNLIVRVYPEVRVQGSLYNYQIQPLNYTPDNLNPDQLSSFLTHLGDNIPEKDELQKILDSQDQHIKVLDTNLDIMSHEDEEPVIDITIEDPGFLHAHIKDIMLAAFKQLNVTKHSFDVPEIEDCNDSNLDLYVDFSRQYITIIECD